MSLLECLALEVVVLGFTGIVLNAVRGCRVIGSLELVSGRRGMYTQSSIREIDSAYEDREI